ncbi:MAG: hypothetical protein PHW60_09460 [Kiritimatiellae bacterium]|nr:hypothetical protein [Kiritimatiellia bacterium]
MTNAIVEAVKVGLEAAGGLPWQVQAGMVAAGVVIGVLGSVAGWIGQQFWKSRKGKNGNQKPTQ